jgi:peptide deformylase
MTIRPLLRWPDPRLTQMCQPVTEFDAGLRDLAADLLETMRTAPGIGITGPHVGVLRRVVVLELAPADLPDGGPRTYVNPVIVWRAAETIRHPEGSIAMPGVGAEIARAAAVRVTYQDLDGEARTEEAEGLRAVCHQHEIDQLDGVFWLRRLSQLKRERVVKRWEKLRRVAGRG